MYKRREMDGCIGLGLNLRAGFGGGTALLMERRAGGSETRPEFCAHFPRGWFSSCWYIRTDKKMQQMMRRVSSRGCCMAYCQPTPRTCTPRDKKWPVFSPALRTAPWSRCPLRKLSQTSISSFRPCETWHADHVHIVSCRGISCHHIMSYHGHVMPIPCRVVRGLG